MRRREFSGKSAGAASAEPVESASMRFPSHALRATVDGAEAAPSDIVVNEDENA
jgi:hypothetical protein